MVLLALSFIFTPFMCSHGSFLVSFSWGNIHLAKIRILISFRFLYILFFWARYFFLRINPFSSLQPKFSPYPPTLSYSELLQKMKGTLVGRRRYWVGFNGEGVPEGSVVAVGPNSLAA
jgi:hypothetical protein